MPLCSCAWECGNFGEKCEQKSMPAIHQRCVLLIWNESDMNHYRLYEDFCFVVFFLNKSAIHILYVDSLEDALKYLGWYYVRIVIKYEIRVFPIKLRSMTSFFDILKSVQWTSLNDERFHIIKTTCDTANSHKIGRSTFNDDFTEINISANNDFIVAISIKWDVSYESSFYYLSFFGAYLRQQKIRHQ